MSKAAFVLLVALAAVVLTARAQVCDDGVFCNGVERLMANGTCVRAPSPCNDFQDCTTDTCDEATQRCTHVVLTTGPCEGTPICSGGGSGPCVPDCVNKTCGPDGCGNSCGTCGDGFGCQAAQCRPLGIGSCSMPRQLLASGEPIMSADWRDVNGDSNGNVKQLTAPCNTESDAIEDIYTFTIPDSLASTGFIAMSMGRDGNEYDTVLYLLKGNCSDSAEQVVCSDDASPPSDFGSRIQTILSPGTYFLVLTGFDSTQFGPYLLKYRFSGTTCIPNCDGAFCGSDLCGGNCGSCGTNETCSAEKRCSATVCVPSCDFTDDNGNTTAKVCGSDGCGGKCGDCPGHELCTYPAGQCYTGAICNHMAPVCSGCSADQYCGADCECHRLTDARPDFVVDEEMLRDEILFTAETFRDTSCAVVEGCLGGIGLRRLMRFSTAVINQGQAAFVPPPPQTRPDLFVYSACHGHYHFEYFSNYTLVDPHGNIVLVGHKMGFCMEDTFPYTNLQNPNQPCGKVHTCDYQGISVGWADVYGNSLDCQWLDITNIPAGNYKLVVAINEHRFFDEMSFSNNRAEIDVMIGEDDRFPNSKALSSSTGGNDYGLNTASRSTLSFLTLIVLLISALFA